MKRLAVGWLLALAIAWMPASHAAPIIFSGFLSGPAEFPPNMSPGTGFALVEIDPDADTMHVIATFSGLLAPTTAAHIHCCTALPFTGAVGVATTLPSFPGFPLGVTAGMFENTFDTSLASTYSAAFLLAAGNDPQVAEANLIAGLREGRAYFNIHTTMFPGGEIRGFLTPEPSSLALIGLAIVAAATLRRRRA